MLYRTIFGANLNFTGDEVFAQRLKDLGRFLRWLAATVLQSVYNERAGFHTACHALLTCVVFV